MFTLRLSYNLGFAYAGKTLYAQIVDDSDSPVGSEMTTGFVECTGGRGLFKQVASLDDATTGFLHVYTSDDPTTILFAVPLNPVEIELASYKALLTAVLNSDTQTEVTGVPAIDSALGKQINWMFTLSRNKTLQTDSATTLRNDADSADLATSATDYDGTTFTRDEWS